MISKSKMVLFLLGVSYRLLFSRRFRAGLCLSCDPGGSSKNVVEVDCKVLCDFGFGVDYIVALSDIGLLSLFLMGLFRALSNFQCLAVELLKCSR